jgi:N6-adenosine-specific RNA methylase IME4
MAKRWKLQDCAQMAPKTPALINKMKKYQIIYADPPWNVSLFSRTVRPQQLPHPYPKMKLEDIKSLPVKDIADQNGSHLFLWTTHKWLPKAFEVMQAWGFNYHCCLTWDKTYGFTPFSFMWSTEFCIYGQIKGKWMKLRKMGEKTLVREKPQKHSKKPQSMRKLILKACGDLSRIELFAREKTPGWDVLGNEVESDVELFAEQE